MYLDNKEYDKITVTSDPKEVIFALGNIPRPGDNAVTITDEDWYKINEAIKLLMDAYGIHYNYEKECFMHDTPELVRNKYWWLDKFKTKYNTDIKQIITQ